MTGAYCLVSREYPPFAGGGIGTYAGAFARLLAERGRRVVVVTAHADTEREDTLETAGEPITVVRLPLQADGAWSAPHSAVRSPLIDRAWHRLGPHSVFAVGVARTLPGLVERFGVSAVEGPDTGAPLLVALRHRGGALSGVPIVTHVHSPSAWIERLNRSIDPRAVMHELQRMEAEQAALSDCVITPSHGMAAWAGTHWGVRADVLRYPIGRDHAAAAGHADEAGGVLFVGRLEYRKGIDTLLRAWPRIRTDEMLHVVGAEVTDHRTERAIGASLLRELPEGDRRRVRMHGQLDPDRVADLQRAARVVVVPSPDDNYPYTCIEAMHAGRVVVAAARGGAAEMIEDGVSGYLFEPYDPDGLAAALGRALALERAQRESVRRAARSRIEALSGDGTAMDARIAHMNGLAAEKTGRRDEPIEQIVEREIAGAEARRRDPAGAPGVGGPAFRTALSTRLSGAPPLRARAAGRLVRLRRRLLGR